MLIQGDEITHLLFLLLYNKKQKLTENSCDFIMLEKACLEYKSEVT